MVETTLPNNPPWYYDAFLCMSGQVVDEGGRLPRRNVLADLQALHPFVLAAQVLLLSQIQHAAHSIADLWSVGVSVVALCIETGLLDVADVLAPAAAEVYHRFGMLILIKLNQSITHYLKIVMLSFYLILLISNIIAFIFVRWYWSIILYNSPVSLLLNDYIALRRRHYLLLDGGHGLRVEAWLHCDDLHALVGHYLRSQVCLFDHCAVVVRLKDILAARWAFVHLRHVHVLLALLPARTDDGHSFAQIFLSEC